jgi:hypothetical protein
MCIIIDINALAPVFKNANSQHNEFYPVYNWIYNGKGKIIFGGTKYISELSRTKYLNLFVQFKNACKAISVNSLTVDNETDRVSELITDKKFNDQHLVGLLIVSRCLLICTLDKGFYPFLKDKRIFPPLYKKPKIYSGRRNIKLLIDDNIAEICKPCSKTTKVQKEIIKK